MTYRVDIVDDVGKQLRKLPLSVRQACDEVIASMADEQRPHGCRKVAGTLNGWRLVIREDYRMLYTIDDESRVVTVRWVGRKEKDIYRRN